MPRQIIVVAFLIERAAALGAGEDPLKFILVQLHPTVVFVVFLVVVIVPAAFADRWVHGLRLPQFLLSYHKFPKKEILAVEFFVKGWYNMIEILS